MKYELFIPVTPPTATVQHKGERIVYDKKTRRPMVMHYMKGPQRKAHDLYVKALKHDFETREDGIGTIKMFTGALIVSIEFLFPHCVNTAKRDRGSTFARTVRPDLDNMAKGLLDCLTEVGLIQDDAQIFDLHLTKFNVPADKQGIRITVTDDVATWYDGDRQEKN